MIAGELIISGSNAKIHAYNKDTGTLIWKHEIGETDHPSNHVYDEKRGLVIIGGLGSGLHALNIENGEIAWSNKQILLGWFNAPTPIIENELLYKRGHTEIGTINLDTGETVSFKNMPVNFDVSGKCLIEGDLIYVATATHGVVAVTKETFDIVRFFPTEGARLFTSPYAYGNIQTVETTPILDEDRLIFAASDGLIYVYDKKSGVLIKKINEGSPIIATPVLKDGYLYTADFLGKVKRYKI